VRRCDARQGSARGELCKPPGGASLHPRIQVTLWLICKQDPRRYIEITYGMRSSRAEIAGQFWSSSRPQRLDRRHRLIKECRSFLVDLAIFFFVLLPQSIVVHLVFSESGESCSQPINHVDAGQHRQLQPQLQPVRDIVNVELSGGLKRVQAQGNWIAIEPAPNISEANLEAIAARDEVGQLGRCNGGK